MSNAYSLRPQKPIKQDSKQGTQETFWGTWRSVEFENGRRFREFKSHANFFGRPVLAIASGIDPETRQMAIADGVIAIGQRARGFVAIGQFVNGYFSLGQFATGRIAAIGQFTLAPFAVGQFTMAIAAVGQMGVAGWGIFQLGSVLFGGIGQPLLNML